MRLVMIEDKTNGRPRRRFVNPDLVAFVEEDADDPAAGSYIVFAAVSYQDGVGLRDQRLYVRKDALTVVNELSG